MHLVIQTAPTSALTNYLAHKVQTSALFQINLIERLCAKTLLCGEVMHHRTKLNNVRVSGLSGHVTSKPQCNYLLYFIPYRKHSSCGCGMLLGRWLWVSTKNYHRCSCWYFQYLSFLTTVGFLVCLIFVNLTLL